MTLMTLFLIHSSWQNKIIFLSTLGIQKGSELDILIWGPGPGRGRGCLQGRVGDTSEPRFLLLLKPAITVPSGNSLLLRGSRYRVALLLLMMAAISGFRGPILLWGQTSFALSCPCRFIKFSWFWWAGPRTKSPSLFFVRPVTSSIIAFTSLCKGWRKNTLNILVSYPTKRNL